MKLTNYALLFVILAAVVVIGIDQRVSNLSVVTKLSVLYNQRVEAAVDDGVFHLTEYDNNEEVFINKDVCVANFYESLFANFYLLHDVNQQNQLKLHIPVMAVTEMDGYYLQYQEVIEKNGAKELVYQWTPKAYFYYEDDRMLYQFFLGSSKDYIRVKDLYEDEVWEGYRADLSGELPNDTLVNDDAVFDQIRRKTIINAFSNALSEVIQKHNVIAERMGITYEFTFPRISWEDWYQTVDDIGFFAVFQGYPYGNGTRDTYNRFIFSGARNFKTNKFFVEEDNGKLWYHIENCKNLKMSEWIYSSKKACAKAGAYPCLVCKP